MAIRRLFLLATLAVFLSIGQCAATPIAHWRFDIDGKSAGQFSTIVFCQLTSFRLAAFASTVPNSPTYSNDVFGASVPRTGGYTNALSLRFERPDAPTSASFNQVLSAPNDSDLNFLGATGSFTLESYVKLDSFGYASPNAEITSPELTRQYVLQKKTQDGGGAALAGDQFAAYTFLANAADLASAGTATWGKQDDFTGRELALAFGDGSQIYTAVSHLEVANQDWNYISASYDAQNQLVRFVLNNQVEWIDVSSVSFTQYDDFGPISIGGHFDEDGQIAHQFDGWMDEVRISAGVVPQSALLVPEPSSLALAGLGLFAAPLCCRRKVARRVNRTRHRRLVAIIFAAMVIAALPIASAKAVPLTLRLVASDLQFPIYGTAAPGDHDRLFIAEQGRNNSTTRAKVKILDRTTGQVLPTPFIEFTGLSFNNEMGLLGMVFHPDYANNGRFYVNVTVRHSDDVIYNEIREYRTSTLNPNVADPSTMKVIGAFPTLNNNHNGGWLEFGPSDGYLYISRGDGRSGSGQGLPAQDLNSSLGKILRIDVNNDDFPDDADRNYAIPSTNPFVGEEGLDEIWAWGLRNPFRASFDSLTHDLYIGDVGSNRWEEINFQPADSTGGENYGWPYREGAFANPSFPNPTPPESVDPIFSFQRPEGGGSAVIGGYVYRGDDIPGLEGTYFFADNVNNDIYSLRYDGENVFEFMNRTEELDADGNLIAIFSFGQDAAGELYVIDGILGNVYQIVAVPEPSTFVLAGCGLGCLLFAYRRRSSS